MFISRARQFVRRGNDEALWWRERESYNIYIHFLTYRERERERERKREKEREKEIGGEKEKGRIQDNIEFDIMQRKMLCAR